MKNDVYIAVYWCESWYKRTRNKRSGGLPYKEVPSKLEVQVAI